MPARTLTVQVGWLALLGVLVLVGLLALAVRRPAPAEPAGPVIDPAAVRRVCEAYAGLDLAELAPLCVAAGYQQSVQLAPEDMGRPTATS